MPSFINYLKTDFYKFNHSKIIKIHFVIPLITMMIFLGYYKVSPLNEVDKVSIYIQVISAAFPFVISVIINLMYEQEELNITYFLSSPNKRYIPHFSKLSLLLILGFISTAISILGFGIMFYFMGNKAIDINIYAKETMIMFGTNIIIYMIQYLVVFAIGKGASLFVGIIGSLLALIMATGLGDGGIWTICPWAYSIRFTSYFLSSNFNHSLVNEEIKHMIIQGIAIMSIFIVLLLIIQIIFSKKWEGRKEY